MSQNPTTDAELHDAMLRIGELMRLPYRTTTSVDIVAVREHPRNARRTRTVALTAVAVLLAAVTALRALYPPPSAEVPRELRGEWTTDHPGYAGKRLAFTRSAVLIAASASGPLEHHAVRTVRLTTRGDSTDVALAYDQDGAPVELDVTVVRGEALALVFARPAGLVWERVRND